MLPGNRFVMSQSVDAVRADFELAAEDENKAEQLLKILSGKLTNPLLIGYRAAAEAMMGKYASAPWNKYSYCKQAMKSFSEAVSGDSGNIEIRYLRIAIQVHLPSFLHMSENIEEDKEVILANIDKSKDKILNRKIATFLLKQAICTEQENKLLRNY